MLVNVQWSDCLMCSCSWAVSPLTDVCMKMCNEPNVLLSAHLHAHVRHTGHCTFTCTGCVHANVHWFDCPMCSCNWGVSRVTEMCMSEPSVWLTAHLLAHVRYSGHCMFTCTWYLHVNVQWSDCVMCSIIWLWAQWLMCAWKCAVSQLSESLHIYMHTLDTRVTARLRACKRAVIRLSDVFDNWTVSAMTDVCMKMCSEPIVLLSTHLHAHVNHSGHCTFTCTWCVLVNVQWTDCLMCSCNWAVGTMTNVCMKMCSEPIVWLSAHLHSHVRHTGHCTFTWTWCVHINMHWSDCPMCSCKWGVSSVTEMCMKCGVSHAYDSMHIYMRTLDSRVTARLHALDVCM